MDALFSCRNCIHNPSQTLICGRGAGYCLKHRSVIWESRDTTCKYLHRKDLPFFLVDEGIQEHAAQFAGILGMARLSEALPVSRIRYSEKFAWERGLFNPLLHSLALYEKSDPSWVFIQTFASGVDGIRSISYSCLIRRCLHNCDDWTSSYRLVLAFLQEIDVEPRFSEVELGADQPRTEMEEEAVWDVLFGRLAVVQEFGWHAALEDLRWATDRLNGALVDFNRQETLRELGQLKHAWTNQIIDLARRENAFFPAPEPDEAAAE